MMSENKQKKPFYTTFTLKYQQFFPVSLTNIQVPHSDYTVKYLGLYFEKKLNWVKHIHITKLSFTEEFLLIELLRKKLNLKSKIDLYSRLNKLI